MPKDMRVYIYSLMEQQGSVGYVSCVPQNSPDLKTSLKVLAAEPYNSFLHDYCLQLLGKNSEEIILSDENGESSVLKALLTELALLNADPEKISVHSDDLLAYTPLPLLAFSPEDFLTRLKLSQPYRLHLENMQKEERTAGFSVPDVNEKIFSRNILQEEFASFSRHNMQKTPLNPAFWKHAENALLKADLADYPEMRHEASLSPIALLRKYPVRFHVKLPEMAYMVKGEGIAYGRGLSLAQARTSLRMEIAERHCAFASIDNDLEVLGFEKKICLVKASCAELGSRSIKYYAPFPAGLENIYINTPFYWFPGRDLQEKVVYAPAQAVFLFCNLPEPSIFETGGSTGLGAGATAEQAKLAALLEVIERDAQATTPFLKKDFFRISSREPLLRDLFQDYAARGIFPVFQDITSETGVPVYKCFVKGRNGAIAQAAAAKLSGKSAALAALTETPWPYSWATPAPFGVPSAIPPASLPVRFLEDLPDYDLGNHEYNLKLLENTLAKLGLPIIYCDLTRKALALPVYRAFVPGLQTHSEFDGINLPPSRLIKKLNN